MFTLDHNNLQLESGKLPLDFANTADWHASAQPEEELNSYTDLVAWGKKVGLVSEGDTRCLLAEASTRPDAARAVLKGAIALREAIYHIFSANAHGLPPESADLAVLNGALAKALSHLQLTHQALDYGWKWVETGSRLDWMLWPIALSAAELLTSTEFSRVGECADDRGCGVLFFDTSRNRSRRWCDMKDCGNRAKARRHYQRVKSA